MKTYSRTNKKHSFNNSIMVFRHFFIDILGHRLRIVGKKTKSTKYWPLAWSIDLDWREIRRYAKAHWWRGNQR